MSKVAVTYVWAFARLDLFALFHMESLILFQLIVMMWVVVMF